MLLFNLIDIISLQCLLISFVVIQCTLGHKEHPIDMHDYKNTQLWYKPRIAKYELISKLIKSTFCNGQYGFINDIEWEVDDSTVDPEQHIDYK